MDIRNTQQRTRFPALTTAYPDEAAGDGARRAVSVCAHSSRAQDAQWEQPRSEDMSRLDPEPGTVRYDHAMEQRERLMEQELRTRCRTRPRLPTGRKQAGIGAAASRGGRVDGTQAFLSEGTQSHAGAIAEA